MAAGLSRPRLRSRVERVLSEPGIAAGPRACHGTDVCGAARDAGLCRRHAPLQQFRDDDDDDDVQMMTFRDEDTGQNGLACNANSSFLFSSGAKLCTGFLLSASVPGRPTGKEPCTHSEPCHESAEDRDCRGPSALHHGMSVSR